MRRARLRLKPLHEPLPRPFLLLEEDEQFAQIRPSITRMPVPLPTPLEQPASCNLGGNLFVTFADGFKFTYGPCRRPSSINRLWAGMIYVLDNGQCAPNCGPGGLAGP